MENTTQVTATPAAIPATKPEEVKVGEGTPQATTEQPKTEPGKEVSQAIASKDDLPKGVKKRLWEQAEKNRTLEAELKALKEQVAKPNATVDTPPELLDDPAKWAERVKNEAATNAETNVLAKLEQAKEAERMKKEHDEALDIILSHKDVKNSEDAPIEIAEILREPEFAHVAAKFPKRAAKMALEEFQNRKGIGMARQEATKSNTMASQSAGTAQSIGQKTWKRSEIESYVAAGSTMSEITKRREEIQRAYGEGRVK